MKTISIQIPDMQSAHCQMRVRNAITPVKGVTIDRIQPGLAIITLEDNAVNKDVTDSIMQAGYTIAGISAKSDETEFRFKTNINCSGCVSRVAPSLNTESGIAEWKVDTESPEKILQIKSNGISREEVIRSVTNAGFKIESINS